ncbi:MAG: class I SAM-dependent methyltransferase [Ruminococcaceae bacterium]|nr:class I SAM-dependent methyltransferase [Oscillospiraceae bacterium]
MKSIDETVLAGYNAGIERNRLRTGIGILEWERSKEILLEHLPQPPAVIYDIGGAYGEYAWWLASLGYEVHLFDLSETNICMSAELASEYPGITLAAAEVCDARRVPRPDRSADAILLMGPLYSITEYDERILAIQESHRLLKKDGLLFSAALTPYSILIPRIVTYHMDDEIRSTQLDQPAVLSAIRRALSDGCWENPGRSLTKGLGSSHLHTARALREELSQGGFRTASVHGVMGGAWLAPNLDALLEKETGKALLLETIRMLDQHEEIIGLSGHLLAVSKKL